jgi:hypothetical protein
LEQSAGRSDLLLFDPDAALVQQQPSQRAEIVQDAATGVNVIRQLIQFVADELHGLAPARTALLIDGRAVDDVFVEAELGLLQRFVKKPEIFLSAFDAAKRVSVHEVLRPES